MMNISSLTDQEKSGLLVEVLGWEVSEPYEDDDYRMVQSVTCAIPGRALIVDVRAPFDLYKPANMSLAWMVLNWALEHSEWRREWLGHMGDALYGHLDGGWEDMLRLPPVEAQRLWLDKILELAIEAGLTELGPKWISDNPDLEAREEFENKPLL